MWIIVNRNPAFGFYNFEGWSQDEQAATRYPSEGEAKAIIQRFNMQADAIQLETPEPPPE